MNIAPEKTAPDIKKKDAPVLDSPWKVLRNHFKTVELTPLTSCVWQVQTLESTSLKHCSLSMLGNNNST